LNSLPFSNL
jgi:tetratricopeptide (TPR) repeat protein